MFSTEFLLVVQGLVAVVVGITETLKRMLKAEGLWAWIMAGIVSVGAVLWHILSTGSPDWFQGIVLLVIVFGEATGLYHVVRKIGK